MTRAVIAVVGIVPMFISACEAGVARLDTHEGGSGRRSEDVTRWVIREGRAMGSRSTVDPLKGSSHSSGNPKQRTIVRVDRLATWPYLILLVPLMLAVGCAT